MFIELLGLIEEVFVVRPAAILGMRSIPCVRKVLFSAGFYVFFVGRGSSRDVGPLGAGLVFATDLLVTGGVGEVD
jgi:hypothetical protein